MKINTCSEIHSVVSLGPVVKPSVVGDGSLKIDRLFFTVS